MTAIVAFILFCSREAASDILTNPVFNAIAKIPEDRVAACRLEKDNK